MANGLTESSELVLHHYAYACFEQGIWEKAIQTFRLLAMFAPQNGEYWFGLGVSLMKSGSDSEAERAFEIASIQAPEDARPLLYWAETLSRLGKLELAKLVIQQAEEKAKNGADYTLQDKIDVIKERVIKAR